MLNVGLIAPGELFGGVERQILDLCDAFRDHPDVTASAFLFHDAALAAALRKCGVEPVVLKTAGSYDVRAPGELDRQLDDRGVEVVHLHGYRAAVTLALGRARRRLGFVKTEHGLPETHGGPSFSALKLTLNSRLDGWATRRLDAAVAYVTEDLRRRCSERHRGLRTRTVHNGISPVDAEAPERPGDLPPSGFTFGIVGRISQVKGIEFAIRAMKDPSMPGKASLAVIGSGPLEEPLKNLADELGVAGKVRFLGFKRSVHGYFAHLDALLMPSLHEGLPYTLLEAMSWRLPVLASAVGGIPEVIEDGRSGLLFAPMDPVAIAAACGAVVRDADLRRRVADEAAGVLHSRFTRDVMVESYVELYRREAVRTSS